MLVRKMQGYLCCTMRGAPVASQSPFASVSPFPEQGATLSLRVRQDSGQYVFSTAPPQCRPHHALVPRWHYDMVQDTLRNEAYDQAIRWALGM